MYVYTCVSYKHVYFSTFTYTPTHTHSVIPQRLLGNWSTPLCFRKTDPRIMFLGGGCSLATEPLAALAGRFYQIPIVSLHVIVLVYTCNKCMVHVMCQISHTCVHYTFNRCILKQKVEKIVCKCTHTHTAVLWSLLTLFITTWDVPHLFPYHPIRDTIQQC